MFVPAGPPTGIAGAPTAASPAFWASSFPAFVCCIWLERFVPRPAISDAARLYSPPTIPNRPAFCAAAARPAAAIDSIRSCASFRIRSASSRMIACCAVTPAFAIRLARASSCAGVSMLLADALSRLSMVGSGRCPDCCITGPC